MHADGKRREAIVGEHPLPRRVLAQRRRLDGWIEWQRELPLLSAGPRHALRLRHEAELPEEHAPRSAEAVARTRCDERLERVLRELRPLRELAHVSKRSLGDDRGRVVIGDLRDVVQADANGVALHARLYVAAVDVGRPNLHAASLRIAN